MKSTFRLIGVIAIIIVALLLVPLFSSDWNTRFNTVLVSLIGWEPTRPDVLWWFFGIAAQVFIGGASIVGFILVFYLQKLSQREADVIRYFYESVPKEVQAETTRLWSAVRKRLVRILGSNWSEEEFLTARGDNRLSRFVEDKLKNYNVPQDLRGTLDEEARHLSAKLDKLDGTAKGLSDIELSASDINARCSTVLEIMKDDRTARLGAMSFVARELTNLSIAIRRGKELLVSSVLTWCVAAVLSLAFLPFVGNAWLVTRFCWDLVLLVLILAVVGFVLLLKTVLAVGSLE